MIFETDDDADLLEVGTSDACNQVHERTLEWAQYWGNIQEFEGQIFQTHVGNEIYMRAVIGI